MGKIIKFPIPKKKIYGYEIIISGRRPSNIREFIGFMLFRIASDFMGFEFMIQPIENTTKVHNSFKVGDG